MKRRTPTPRQVNLHLSGEEFALLEKAAADASAAAKAEVKPGALARKLLVAVLIEDAREHGGAG